MGALTEKEEARVSDIEQLPGKAEVVLTSTAKELAAIVRRLAGRVDDTGAALFRAENDISNALCSLRANDHQTREILEAARMRIWVARGIELPAPTAPREAATVPHNYCKLHNKCDCMCICAEAAPTDLPTGKETPPSAGNIPSGKAQSTGAECACGCDCGMKPMRGSRFCVGCVDEQATPTSEESE